MLSSAQFKDLFLKKYHDFRVFAIDGTSLDLPNIEALDKYFGNYKNSVRNSSPRARVSLFYDCLNQVIYDSIIAPVKVSEPVMAFEHIERVNLPEKSIITLDRGYHDSFFRFLMMKKGYDYCMRLKGDEGIVKDFLAENISDKIIDLVPGKHFRPKCKAYGMVPEVHKVRLIRVPLKSGEVEILASSLLNEEYDINFFKQLYHLRWGIEEGIKVLKTRIRIEKFLGQSPLAIKQEFYARVFMHNVASMIRNVAEPKLKERQKHSYLDYQINFKVALAKFRICGRLLFGFNTFKILKLLIKSFIEDKVPIRKGRSYERRIIQTRRSHEYQKYSGI